MQRKPPQDIQLLLAIASLLFVNLAILIIWEIADPRSTHLIIYDTETGDGDYQITTYVEECHSSYDTVFIGILMGLQSLILLFGSFLAFETRKVFCTLIALG